MNIEDLIERVKQLENKQDLLEDKILDICIANSEFKIEIKNLNENITNLKLEIIQLLSEQMGKQWKLIIGLVSAIVVLIGGTKLAPEILKALI